MREEDLPACEAVGDVVHVAHPEDEGRMTEKFRLFPAGCFVRRDGALILGYVIAHPWRSGEAVALNAPLGALPVNADTLYLHDLALLPAAWGQGAGRAAAYGIAALAGRSGYPSVSLVAVGGTLPFWERIGFRIATVPGLAAVLRGYGRGAAYMRRDVAGPSRA